jgi:hypothetical protein
MSSLKGDSAIAPQEIYTSSTTQNTDIGARFTAGDGRVFRYVSAGTTALVAGKVYQSAAIDTTNFTNVIVAAAGTNTTTVTTTGTITLTANQLSGGILSVRNGIGLGFGYRIKSHPAITTGTVAFILEDPLVAGLTATSHVDLIPNPYANVYLAPTTLTGVPIGVATANTAGTNYGWVQTRGLCPVISDATIAVGMPASPSSATAGNFMPALGTWPVVAFSAEASAAGSYTAFFLTFE